MAILSKAHLELLRQAFGAPQLVLTQEKGEVVLPCVRSSYFRKDEVEQFLKTLEADYLQVQLVVGLEGNVSMVMNGAVTNAATGDPGKSVFFSLENEGGELGLLSEHDCPPRCEDDDGDDDGDGPG